MQSSGCTKFTLECSLSFQKGTFFRIMLNKLMLSWRSHFHLNGYKSLATGIILAAHSHLDGKNLFSVLGNHYVGQSHILTTWTNCSLAHHSLPSTASWKLLVSLSEFIILFMGDIKSTTYFANHWLYLKSNQNFDIPRHKEYEFLAIAKRSNYPRHSHVDICKNIWSSILNSFYMRETNVISQIAR